MTNDIIEIARQTEATVKTRGKDSWLNHAVLSVTFTPDQLTKFAELIQARAVPDGHVVVPDRRLVSAGGTEKIAGYILTKGGWQDYCLTKMVLKRFAPAAAQKGSV